jgi:hypothetical protein
LRSALGLAHLFINSGRETAGSDLLTRALIDLDTGQDFPEIEQAKKLFGQIR